MLIYDNMTPIVPESDSTDPRFNARWAECSWVIDHATGRLVWAAEGRNKDTLGKFFDQLGSERARLLTHVGCDRAERIHAVLRARAPQAVICLDPFTKRAYGFHSPDALIGMAMLTRGALCPALPGRAA
ncbi:transposase [Mycobacterium sp. Lab-001]|uniref:transposase n=1 Tax=Mycobacterium sp. Lab-001 TaxID=3410136 RepID=UPI003D16C9F9